MYYITRGAIICHDGKKGMRWYHRLYQYPDGRWTPLGKLRYGGDGKNLNTMRVGDMPEEMIRRAAQRMETEKIYHDKVASLNKSIDAGNEATEKVQNAGKSAQEWAGPAPMPSQGLSRRDYNASLREQAKFMTDKELKAAAERKRLEDEFVSKYSVEESAMSKAIKQALRTAVSNAIQTQVNNLANDVLGIGVDFIENATGISSKKIGALHSSWEQEVDKEIYKAEYKKQRQENNSGESDDGSSGSSKKATVVGETSDKKQSADGWNKKKGDQNAGQSTDASDTPVKKGKLFNKKGQADANSDAKKGQADANSEAKKQALKKEADKLRARIEKNNKAETIQHIKKALRDPDIDEITRSQLRNGLRVLTGTANKGEEAAYRGWIKSTHDSFLSQIRAHSSDTAPTEAPRVAVEFVEKMASVSVRDYNGPSL